MAGNITTLWCKVFADSESKKIINQLTFVKVYERGSFVDSQCAYIHIFDIHTPRYNFIFHPHFPRIHVEGFAPKLVWRFISRT